MWCRPITGCTASSTRHPVALATLAGHHLAACVEGARQGYRCARAELGKDLPPGSLAAVLAAYQTEGQPARGRHREAADLVSRALRGETFVPQFGGSPDSRRPAAQPATGSGRGPAASRQASGSAAGRPQGRAGEGATGRGAAR